ncbi:metallophosphoesterase domain-containing protein [Planoprotostelium fungivorum]|uniref:Metallophosphoesterase domain-containing protein n=1 Tax=Planoprotostelium fungivorum TaxID=1890364 RepID=A0A2P6N7J7_9EUKA|nr:metallophosphoesterase domain-containing protein [Planoprotostelium fungivorum]
MRHWLLIALLTWVTFADRPPLRFRRDGTFKIAQFSDLHFGEAEETDWGPKQDEDSLRYILDKEKPDLVVLTGDVITGEEGNNIVDNATTYWRMALSPMIKRKIEWASAFGNHCPIASGINGTRTDLMREDVSHASSRSQFGPSDIEGVSNYALPIHDHTGATFMLYLMDSNYLPCLNSSAPCFYPNQVEWLERQMKLSAGEDGSVMPSFAFFHIPIIEYDLMWNCNTSYGYQNDTEVASQGVNTGMFRVFQENGGTAIFVGHNHGNDYCGTRLGVKLCYGRHTGHGGYGDEWKKGARIIKIHNRGSLGRFSTWLRMEDGEKITKEPVHVPDGACESSE